jgi:hypothetical protein
LTSSNEKAFLESPVLYLQTPPLLDTGTVLERFFYIKLTNETDDFLKCKGFLGLPKQKNQELKSNEIMKMLKFLSLLQLSDRKQYPLSSNRTLFRYGSREDFFFIKLTNEKVDFSKCSGFSALPKQKIRY